MLYLHRKLQHLMVAAVALAGLAAMTSSLSAQVQVAASFSVLGDMAARIGGERVLVTSIVGPDSDTHGHAPSPADLRAIAGADLVVTNGLGFDSWIERAIGASGFDGLHLNIGQATQVQVESRDEFLDANRHTSAFLDQSDDHHHDHDGDSDRHGHEEEEDHHEHEASDGHGQHGEDDHHHDHEGDIDHHEHEEETHHAHETSDGHSQHGDADDHHDHHGHDHSGPDPHAWQSPIRSVVYVEAIAEALTRVDPAGGDAYSANAKLYLASLQILDREMIGMVNSLPADRRRILTAHDSFGYLARDYGLTTLAIEGLSTESQPSAGDIASLHRQSAQNKLAAAFADNVTNPRPLRQFLQETGLVEGGFLYSDALSAAGGPADSHLGMLRHNLLTLSAALDADGHGSRRTRLEDLTIPNIGH